METETSRGSAARRATTPRRDGKEVTANGPEAAARRSDPQPAPSTGQVAQGEQETLGAPINEAGDELQATFPRPNIGLEPGTELEVDDEFVSVAGAPTVWFATEA